MPRTFARGIAEIGYLSCYFLFCQLYSDRSPFECGCSSADIDLILLPESFLGTLHGCRGPRGIDIFRNLCTVGKDGHFLGSDLGITGVDEDILHLVALAVSEHGYLEGCDKIHMARQNTEITLATRGCYLVNVFAHYLAVRRHYFKTYFIFHGSAPPALCPTPTEFLRLLLN